MIARKKRNVMILALCLVLVFMGIGYAILTQTLDVKGTSDVDGVWQVNITSINATKINGKAVNKNTTITNGGKTANFTADLFDIGDYVEYTVTVKNEGNIAAKVTNVNQSVTNANQHVKMSVDGINKNNVIQPGKSINFTAKVYVDAQSSADLEDQEGIIFTITLDFVQTQNKQNVIVDNGGGNVEDAPLFDEDISKTANDNVRFKFYSDGKLVIYGTGDSYDSLFDETSMKGFGLQNFIALKYIAKQANMNDDGLLCENVVCEKYYYTSLASTGIYLDSYFDEQVLNNPNISQQDKTFLTRMHEEIPKITSVEIQDGVKSIGNGLLIGLSKVDSISFPDSIEKIGEQALIMSSVKSIRLPENDNFTTIENSFCFACEKLESLIIPDNVQIIKNGAFNSCFKLSNLSLGSGVTTIEKTAFYSDNLTSVIIPENVSSIGNIAFKMDSLQTVNLYGNSNRFDSNWSKIFGSATKVPMAS